MLDRTFTAWGVVDAFDNGHATADEAVARLRQLLDQGDISYETHDMCVHFIKG